MLLVLVVVAQLPTVASVDDTVDGIFCVLEVARAVLVLVLVLVPVNLLE